MISLIVSLILLVVLCSFVWWLAPVLLAGMPVPRPQQIAALIILLVVLVWISGGFGWGWSDAPWGWGPHRGRP